MKVRNKVIVVTGAGSGMGRELVLTLLRRGARVAGVDLRAEALATTAELASAGERLSVHVLDITDRSAVDELPDAVVGHHGSVDGLVNCAGIIQPFTPVADLDEVAMQRVMDVNFWGTVHLVKAFLPVLEHRPEAHIANFSSMGGFLPVPGQAVYGASKAAVKLLTEALYAELLDTPIRVSVVMPGAVATSITANSGVDIPRDPGAAEKAAAAMLPADQAARIIADGIEHDRLHILVGRDAQLMSAAMRTAPRRAIHLIQKRMKGLLSQGQATSAGT